MKDTRTTPGSGADRPAADHTEQQARDLEAFHLLLENVSDFAIFFLDAGGRVTYWNRGAERIFGYSESEIIGLSFAVFFTSEDQQAKVYEQEMQKALAEGRVEDDRWLVRKDGTQFFASGVLTRLANEAGTLRGFAKIFRDNTALKQAEEELRDSHKELEERVRARTSDLNESYRGLQAEVTEHHATQVLVRELLRKQIASQEEERQRISRDLHDTLGQQITALRLKVEMVKAGGDGAGLAIGFTEVVGLIKEIDAHLDFLAWELRTPALDLLGLPAAIEAYVQEWSQTFGVEAEVQVVGFDGQRLLPEAEMSLYRIVQEALNNTAKYAGASRAEVILARKDGAVVLVIEDDGRGFNLAEVAKEEGRKKLGLIGMSERAALAGGEVEIESAPGEGTTVKVRVPIIE
jgi:PAS domain S-box-containing protein